MVVAFDENACLIAIAISSKVMTTLKSFNAIMATFYGRVGPAASMIVHDFLFPVAHGFEGTANGGVVDSISLLAPTPKSRFSNGIVRGAVVPNRERFFPFPYAAQKRRVLEQRIQTFSTFFAKRFIRRIQQPMVCF